MSITIRKANEEELMDIGSLMVTVYSELDGFPKPEKQPQYYHMLQNIGLITKKPGVTLFVAHENGGLLGAVVYFADMAQYGSGGTATKEKNTAGFRLLAVSPQKRGKGIGRLLSQRCIEQAKADGIPQMIIHSTESMKVAWGMYERMGFQRSIDLDFIQKELPVFGFRLKL